MGQTLIRIVPAILVGGVIFFLSHQPGDLLGPYPFRWADKLAHLAVYAILCVTLIYAFPRHYRCSSRKTVAAVSVIFCLVYGISDEFHQSFIPGRYPSIADIGADVVGAMLACMLWLRLSNMEHAGESTKR
jgi:VanZ family protein